MSYLVFARVWVNLPGEFPDVSCLDSALDRHLPDAVMPLCRELFPGSGEPVWRDDHACNRWLQLDLDDGGRLSIDARAGKQIYLVECADVAEADLLVRRLNEGYRPGEDVVDLALDHLGLEHPILGQIRFGHVAREELTDEEHLDALVTLRPAREGGTTFLDTVREEVQIVREHLRLDPDETAVHPGLEPEQPAAALPERVVRAWRLLARAESENPDLKGATDAEVYRWLRDEADGVDGLPSQETFTRYLRDARKAFGLQKYGRGGGHPTRSIVRAEDVDLNRGSEA